MAVDKSDLSTKELLTADRRSLVAQALSVYRQTLVRARDKYVPGSATYDAMSKDIAAVDSVKEVFQ